MRTNMPKKMADELNKISDKLVREFVNDPTITKIYTFNVWENYYRIDCHSKNDSIIQPHKFAKSYFIKMVDGKIVDKTLRGR